jgi:hypothetical protein
MALVAMDMVCHPVRRQVPALRRGVKLADAAAAARQRVADATAAASRAARDSAAAAARTAAAAQQAAQARLEANEAETRQVRFVDTRFRRRSNFALLQRSRSWRKIQAGRMGLPSLCPVSPDASAARPA